MRDTLGVSKVKITANPSRSVMHIESDSGDIKCSSDTCARRQIEKDISVFPVGYYDWCSRCVLKSLSKSQILKIGIEDEIDQWHA